MKQLSLGTNKPSKVVVLYEDSVVVTQRKLKLNLTSLGLGSRYLYEFSLSNNYISSFKTTTCDALIVPSVNSVILNLNLNLTSMRNIYTKRCMVRMRIMLFTWVFVEYQLHCLRWEPQHVTLWLYPVVYISFRWVITTCLRWQPQPVTIWLYPVVIWQKQDLLKMYTNGVWHHWPNTIA